MRNLKRLLLFVLLTGIGAPIYSQQNSCDYKQRACIIEFALETASTTSRHSTRNEIYFAVTMALLKTGKILDAKIVSKLINNEIILSELKTEFALNEASQGNFDTAFEIANSINDARNQSQRINALEELAKIQASQLGIEPAFKTVSAIANPFRRSQAQAAISIELARAGMLTKALKAATQIGTDYWFSETKTQFNVASGVVARTKDFDQFWFYEALIEISAAQGMSGDLKGALNTVLSIPDLEARSKGFSRITELLASKGNYEEALDLTKRIETAFGDKLAYNLIIEQLTLQGGYSQALFLANKLKGHYGDERGLVFLATNMIKDNEIMPARKILDDLSSIENKNRILTQLISHYVLVNDIFEVLAIINELRDRKVLFECIKEITSILARNNENEKALNLANRFLNAEEMDEIYLIISLESARQRDMATSFELMGKIKNKADKAIAMVSILEFVD